MQDANIPSKMNKNVSSRWKTVKMNLTQNAKKKEEEKKPAVLNKVFHISRDKGERLKLVFLLL